MIVLVLNCGSATVKYELFEGDATALDALAAETVEIRGDYRGAIERVLGGLPRRVEAVGHRVVHGGTRFLRPARVDDEVVREIRRLVPLAPLHNPPALEGIEAARRLGVPMVACFDTAFHAAIPDFAARYALPGRLGPEVRRYGFHGLSHQYVTERYAELAGSPEPTIVTLHLGQGCSATAVRRGASVDTSMGFSPLEGLVMGTRGGDLDPAILLHLLRRGATVDEIDRLLHRESGLAGLAGTNDMREVLARTDPDARLAVEIFCYRARKYVGAYLAALGGAEAVVFTGGIGENAPEIRRRITEGLDWAGLAIDPARNAAGEGRISTDASRLRAWVIKTDEERLIARQTVDCLRKPA